MGKRFRLPSEIPLEEYPPPLIFIEEALNCVEESADNGITLRIMGGLAIYLQSKDYEELWRALGRLGERVFTDIDFASYSKFSQRLLNFFEKRGYSFNPRLLWRYGRKRQIFFDGKVPMVEVFFDKLEMNHTIDFRKRLELSYPTIPLAELLLQKLQMVHMDEKDYKDVIVLLRSRDIGESDRGMINILALAKAGLLSNWGFYYTVTTNLKNIRDSLGKYDVLTGDDVDIIRGRVDRILGYLENQPKSISWKLRARVGAKKKWYNDVDEWAGRL